MTLWEGNVLLYNNFILFDTFFAVNVGFNEKFPFQYQWYNNELYCIKNWLTIGKK